MSAKGRDPEYSAEQALEDAPCGLLSMLPDGTIEHVNSTLTELTGYSREELQSGRRFRELLTPGGQIYFETHVVPLLRMQGSIGEIALEVVRPDGSRLPVLINAVLRRDDADIPCRISATVSDATGRRSYERELLETGRRDQELASRLQRSLLSGSLPNGGGVEVHAKYSPGVSGLQVGGDWYDAFWLDERRVALVVGDVVGRGIDAAITMGQLRSAVRALATTGLAPGAVLEALDGYAHRHELGSMATLVYGSLDLSSRVFRFACAGHPPPLLLEPDREPQFFWGGRSTPLDVSVGAKTRADCEVHLCRGSSILLYTDGLIEHRSRSLDDGMALLAAQARLWRELDPRSMADALMHALVPNEEDPDDKCLLVARLA